MSVLDSWDAILASIATHGAFRRNLQLQTSEGHTVPTSTAGGPTEFKRFTPSITMPSMGAGILGAYLIQLGVSNGSNQSGESTFVALEYELGSLNLATAVFTAGVTMPTKRYSGRPAVQTAAQMTCLYVSATLTATTPTITVTYTNQDGVGSKSAALDLVTNTVAGTLALLNQNLASGDVGMRSVENMTKSAGTVGTVKVLGYLILSGSPGFNSPTFDPMTTARPNWLLETGDKITFLESTGRSISGISGALLAVAET